MALGATHIRFAKDLKDKYGVSDMRAYLSGTLYPDSRYVTGVERSITHPKDLEAPFFQSTDFNKGWLAHLICDNVQYQITEEWIPEAFDGTKGEGSTKWINLTALKVLQDIDDFQKFDVKQYALLLDYVQTPNGEPEDKIKEFNQAYMSVYVSPVTGISQLCGLLRRVKVGGELTAAIRAKSEEYAANPNIMRIVPKIYPEMLRRAK